MGLVKPLYLSSGNRTEMGASDYMTGISYILVSLTNISSPYPVVNTVGMVIILCDATSGAITVNLPTAVGNKAMYRIKKTDSSTNAVTVDAFGAETIDDGLTAILQTQYEAIDLIPNNANFFIF